MHCSEPAGAAAGERAVVTMGGPKSTGGGSRGDGPNWVVVAGGAIVMAVGIVIGRKQIQCSQQAEQGRSCSRASSRSGSGKPEWEDSRLSSSKNTPGSHGVVYDSDSPGMKELFDDNFSPDGTSSQLSWKAPRATTYWDDDSGTPVSSSHPQCELNSSKAKRGIPATKPSHLPASRPCRQVTDDPRGRDELLSDSYSSPALRAGLEAKREMVQKLRKQLKSKDGIIFDLQAQVSDQDQVITMHRVHTADLHARLNTANTELFKSNHEIHRLREELRMQCGKLPVNIDDHNGLHDIFNGKENSMTPDLKAIIHEARMLSEKVKRLQSEKQEMESEVQAFSRECEMLFRKASALEAERVQLKRLLDEKEQLLEAKEDECMKLTIALVKLHPDNILDIETRDRDSDWTRSSKVNTLSDTQSESYSRCETWSDHGFDQPVSCHTPDDYYSPSATTIVDGDINHRPRATGDLIMRSYNTLFRQSPSRLDSDGSVSKPGSRAVAHGYSASKSTCDGSSPNYCNDGTDHSNYDNNEEGVSLSLVRSLQQEVCQLSDALASRSKAVSQRKVETSRVLTEFQATQTTLRSGPEEYEWEDLSQVLSFSPDGTSAERIQELSHKLEKVAKQQQVEDEIEALCRYQGQITALKSRLSKLSAKCNAEIKNKWSPGDEIISNDTVRGMLLDLADKLDAQEDQVRETTMDIQQLSMSLQLSSPYVPRSKKQELQRMLQGGSRQADCPVFERTRHKDIPISPDHLPSVKSSYSIQEQKLDSSSSRRVSRLYDRQISFSSLPNKAAPSYDNFEVTSGAASFDPLPSSGKIIRKSQGNNTHVGKSSSRRVCFSPEEGTSGFSFPSAGNDNYNPDKGAAVVTIRHKKITSPHAKSDMDSDDFQWIQVEEPQQEPPPNQPITTTSFEILNTTFNNYFQTNNNSPTSHNSSQPLASSDRTLSDGNNMSSPAIETRDCLRRFLFKSEQQTGTGTLSLANINSTVFESAETTAALESKPCLLSAEFQSPTDQVCRVNIDDGGRVQIKRLTSEDSFGGAGVSSCATRMACLDVTKSPHEDHVKRPTSSFNSALEDVVGDRGKPGTVSFLLLEGDGNGDREGESDSSVVDWKSVIGKENRLGNEQILGFGSQQQKSSKKGWVERRSMSAKDLMFRCDRRSWNSFQDSQR